MLGLVLIAATVPVCHFLGYRKGGWTGAWALSFAAASHAILAILSAAGIALPAHADNLDFHGVAVAFAHGGFPEVSGPSSRLWSYAISYVYAVLDGSLWLGYALNQWIYVLLLIQLLAFCKETGVGQFRWLIVVAFSLLPSSLLFNNFLLREPLQILCLIIAVRHMERFRRLGHARSLLVAFAALVPFGAIHNGFFLFAPIALAGAIMARVFLPPGGQRLRRVPGAAMAGLALGMALLAASVVAVGSFSEHRRVAQIMEGDFDVSEAIEASAGRGGRTAFPWRPPVAGLAGLVYSPIQLFQFLFAPVVPFMIGQPRDLLAAFDVATRVLMLLGVVLSYRRADPDARRMILFLVGTYVVFCLVASIGTHTVGTALRHQLKVFWIIIALGLPGLMGSFAAAPSRPTPTLRKAGL